MQSDAAAWFAIDVQVGAIIVSAALAGLTLLLWLESKRARQSTERALSLQEGTIKRQLEFAEKTALAAEQSAKMAEESAKTTRQVFEQAREQFIREHRSKLTVPAPGVKTVSGQNGRDNLEITLTLQNLGKSDALDLQVHHWLFQDSIIIAVPQVGDGSPFKNFSRKIIAIQDKFQIVDHILAPPSGSTSSIFVFGTGTYTDSVSGANWTLEWAWNIQDNKITQFRDHNSAT